MSLHLRGRDSCCFPCLLGSHRNLSCKPCRGVSGLSLSQSISAACRWVPGSAGEEEDDAPSPAELLLHSPAPGQPRAQLLLRQHSSTLAAALFIQLGVARYHFAIETALRDLH